MKAMHEMLDFWALDLSEICHDCGTIWFRDRRTKRKFFMTVDISDEQSTNKIGDVFEFAARVVQICDDQSGHLDLDTQPLHAHYGTSTGWSLALQILR